MVFIGEGATGAVRIDAIRYDAERLEEHTGVSPARAFELAAGAGTLWLNVTGIHDQPLVEAISRGFGLHPLTVEDILDTGQRPKTEAYPDYLFVALKMMAYDPAKERVDIEHVSLVVTRRVVVTFLEDEGDLFDGVRGRLRAGKGRIRAAGPDHLAYALIDAVVDHYYLAIEAIGDRIEEADDRILLDPRPEDIQYLHHLKRDILALRKAVWPLREAIGMLEKGDSALVAPETRLFLRDLYDHTIQVIDMVETYRDLLAGMHDTYLSSISFRMNEIMKVLTVISTLFIPLTFIAGVYGMNFEHMPELKWETGYYLCWALMVSLALGMLVFFRRRGWI